MFTRPILSEIGPIIRGHVFIGTSTRSLRANRDDPMPKIITPTNRPDMKIAVSISEIGSFWHTRLYSETTVFSNSYIGVKNHILTILYWKIKLGFKIFLWYQKSSHRSQLLQDYLWIDSQLGHRYWLLVCWMLRNWLSNCNQNPCICLQGIVQLHSLRRSKTIYTSHLKICVSDLT